MSDILAYVIRLRNGRFLRKFGPDGRTYTSPGLGKARLFDWSDECIKAYNRLNARIGNNPEILSVGVITHEQKATQLRANLQVSGLR